MNAAVLTTRTVPETTGVTLFRLYLLRSTYLLIAVGLGLMVWPSLVHHSSEWAVKNGDTFGLLSGIQVLAILGIRYPLKMLPLLLFEFTWKAIWLTAVALPLWRAGQIDPGTQESIKACAMGVVICGIAIPWPYMVDQFIRANGDHWKQGHGRR